MRVSLILMATMFLVFTNCSEQNSGKYQVKENADSDNVQAKTQQQDSQNPYPDDSSQQFSDPNLQPTDSSALGVGTKSCDLVYRTLFSEKVAGSWLGYDALAKCQSFQFNNKPTYDKYSCQCSNI